MSTSFKADDERISDIGYFLKNKSEELDNLYSDLLKICDDIEKDYISEDSPIYMAKYRSYIKQFLLENEDLKDGGNVLNKTSSTYSEQENTWAKQIMENEELLKKGEYYG